MRPLIILSTCLILGGTAFAAPRHSKQLRLTSLLSPCFLQTRWIDIVPPGETVMLTCGEAEFLVLSPSNLFGHVAINTPSNALEFVRLFTAPDSYQYFDLGGMVELVPGKVTDKSPFNVVDQKVF